MAGNVLSWDVALDKGYEPRLYFYTFEDVPLGEYEAILDFKIWAKTIIGISCYFTQAGTGKKFQLTVYCKPGVGVYKIEGCKIDFAQCPIERLYQISVIANEKKRIVFANARLL
jgi:hypothetical protein